MTRMFALSLLLGFASAPVLACEFHGGPWGMAFARMMHAGPATSDAATAAGPDAQAQAQANDVALAALRAQFLQRFNVKVEGEPAGATATASPPTAQTAPAASLP